MPWIRLVDHFYLSHFHIHGTKLLFMLSICGKIPMEIFVPFNRKFLNKRKMTKVRHHRELKIGIYLILWKKRQIHQSSRKIRSILHLSNADGVKQSDKSANCSCLYTLTLYDVSLGFFALFFCFLSKKNRFEKIFRFWFDLICFSNIKLWMFSMKCIEREWLSIESP